MTSEALPARDIAAIVRRTLAYAAGVDQGAIDDDTEVMELGIDSVSSVASGVVLEAELGVTIDQGTLVRIFSAARVSDIIRIVTDAVAIPK